jgi:hypothetical protein
VAVLLLVFAWKGSALTVNWPPQEHVVVPPAPTAEELKWAEPLRKVLPKMLLTDREYLASFYAALGFVVDRDAARTTPIITTTEAFAQFHGGSLQLAVDHKNVGKYPGLAEAIDEVFVSALGAEARPLDDASRRKLTAACSVLSHAFKVGGDG